MQSAKLSVAQGHDGANVGGKLGRPEPLSPPAGLERRERRENGLPRFFSARFH
jgi:hypothetical protein